jgi:hypothetical protein
MLPSKTNALYAMPACIHGILPSFLRASYSITKNQKERNSGIMKRKESLKKIKADTNEINCNANPENRSTATYCTGHDTWVYCLDLI